MAPCLVLPLVQNVYLPQFPSHLEASASSLLVKASASTPEADAVFTALRELASAPIVSFGTPQQLSAYQEYVQQHIAVALAAARVSPTWATASGVAERLERALGLVNANKTSQGRGVALEVLGFATLAAQAGQSDSGCCSSGWSTSSSTSSTGGAFKVPALPSKRPRPQEQQQPQQQSQQQQQQAAAAAAAALAWQPQSNAQSNGQQQQQPRRHAAPKRRATPQVLPGGPFSITPAAPPASSTHGETCCDEQLLSYWCPISGKRQRASPPRSTPPAASCSTTSSSSSELSQQQLPAVLAPRDSSAVSSQQQQQRSPPPPPAPKQAAAAGSSQNAPTSSSSDCAARLTAAHGASPPPPPPPPAPSSSLRGRDRHEAAAALKRLLHEDPSVSKPAADVLLFKQANQQPIINWTGTIKHKADGRVVELCTLTLQVPEPFLEEFPPTLYAADVRHRRCVSLGRHVVCRSHLGGLGEHQLAGLAAMARGQLVALCSLQTAELHLVPYFDNKNLVRMVGFLKIKAE